MIEIIKKSFGLTFKNSILTSAFIFIFVLIQLFGIFALARPSVNYAGFITSFVIVNLLCVALFSGWLKIAETTVRPPSRDTYDSSWSIFFEGIGEKFWMNLKIAVFYSLLFTIVTILAYTGLAKAYPIFQLSHADIVSILQKVETLTPTSANIFDEKLVVFLILAFILNTALFAGMYLFSFLLADIYLNNEDKFFRNLMNAVKFLFRNFLPVIGLFLILAILYFWLSFFTFLFQTNLFLSVLGIILTGYYASFYIIVVFLMYEQKKDTSNSDNGCDSNGQDKVCD